MKIWIPSANRTGPQQNIFSDEVRKRYDRILTDAKIVEAYDSPGDADMQLQFYAPFVQGDAPLYFFLDSLDKHVFARKHWWPFGSSGDALADIAPLAAGIFVPHQALAKRVYDLGAAHQNVHLVGHGPPAGLADLPPTDSVTRRITKEVYGREKSFFLAPTTGHPSDNLEVLVTAYDHFRRRCDEEVLLLIPQSKKKFSRRLRRAIKQSDYRADIVILSLPSPAEYWKIYSSARAILYSSLSTRFPLEILRAWHARVPILAGDVAVLDGAGAQVGVQQVRCTDYESVAEGMVALVTTPFLASGLVERGSERLREFTWDGVARRVAEVLRTAAG